MSERERPLGPSVHVTNAVQIYSKQPKINQGENLRVLRYAYVIQLFTFIFLRSFCLRFDLPEKL